MQLFLSFLFFPLFLYPSGTVFNIYFHAGAEIVAYTYLIPCSGTLITGSGTLNTGSGTDTVSGVVCLSSLPPPCTAPPFYPLPSSPPASSRYPSSSHPSPHSPEVRCPSWYPSTPCVGPDNPTYPSCSSRILPPFCPLPGSFSLLCVSSRMSCGMSYARRRPGRPTMPAGSVNKGGGGEDIL